MPVTFRDLIKPECVACNVQARSKKHCLEILSELLAGAEQETPSERVFASLVERERLGSTCLARGIAFPHCRVSGIGEEHAAVVKLAEPVEFDAPDGEMVDLVFGLMVPEVVDAACHATIEQVAGLLSNPELCARLRAAQDSEELYRRLQAAEQAGGAERRHVRHG
ncbi:MAG TPA: PTS sugar transporter subunit IIA [Woeseiaceae bacterium]|nr:PTS sugar transporter subunit IIA [Woeseiaceae bacterium]